MRHRGSAWTVLAASLAMLVVFAAATAVRAEQRLALVVGNSGYASGPLLNPKADAEIIAKALAAVGFTVTRLIDADQKTMRRAVVEFGRKLRTTEAVGLFYYAGHGVQVDGENFLVPIGADITAEQEVAVEGLNLNEVLKTMERASSRVNIVVLDACRNNPFLTSSRSAIGGLANVTAPAGTLIAFATAPGRVATDGDGANSPYSAALAETIQVPGLSLEEVFRRTRRQVLAVTANKQTPWEHSSLTVEFFFRAKTAAEPETSSRPADVGGLPERQVEEIKAWERIKDTQDAELLRRHVEAYPGGLFADLARLRLEQLARRDKTGNTVAGWLGGILGTQRGDPEAIRLLEEGLKLESKATPDALRDAFERYKAAADRGLPAAMHQVARAYDKGRGVERSIAEAARWYQKAADLGHPPAMAALGTLYEFAEGVAVDLAEALRLYRLAAEAGEPNGMTSLAYLYQQGKGVARDGAEARRWYAEAAAKDNTRAMYNLALMHTRGEGGPRDFGEAVRYLGLAIAKGHVGAHRELAYLYDSGQGVKRDAATAARHLLAAYKAGHPDARMDLLVRPEAWSPATRREVQKQLKATGHYQGRITGHIDPATRRAIEAYGG